MKTMNNLCRLVALIFILVFLNRSSFAQGYMPLSTADSIYIESIKSDTVKLRLLTLFNGTRKAARAKSYIGLHAFKSGDNDKALNEFAGNNKLNAAFPEKNESEYFLGRIKQRKGLRTDAKAHFKKYLQTEKNGPWADGAHYYYVLTLNDEKDTSTATECMKYLSQRPGGYYAKDVRFHLVNHYRRNTNYTMCIQEAEQLIQQFPQCTYAQDLKLQIGDWYVKLGKREQAKQYFRDLMNENGRWADGAHYHLIIALKKENDTVMAEECRIYLQQRPGGAYIADVRFQLINHYRRSHDYMHCIQEAELLIEQSPESNYAKDLKFQIGDFYSKMGRLEDARQYFRELIVSNPVNTEPAAAAQFLLAKTYENENDFLNARKEYKKVKLLHPAVKTWASASEFSCALSYANEAAGQQDSALWQNAIVQFDNFITTFPKDKRIPIAWNNKADIFTRFEKWGKAVLAYDAVINFDPALALNILPGYIQQTVKEHGVRVKQARMAKAKILLEKMNNPEAALIEYNLLLETFPENMEALYGKALALIAIKNVSDAKPVLQKIIGSGTGLSPAAKELLNNLGN